VDKEHSLNLICVSFFVYFIIILRFSVRLDMV
jgi:hypothetical protein